MAHEEPPDPEADFWRLYEAEHPWIVAYLRYSDFSHDIALDAAFQAFMELRRSWFDVHTSRRMWLRATAKRIAVRMAHAERGRLRSTVPDAEVEQQPDPDALHDAVEQQLDLVRAIRSLPEPLRDAFVLHLDHFTTAQIAVALNVSQRTAQLRVQQARAELRVLLASGEENR